MTNPANVAANNADTSTNDAVAQGGTFASITGTGDISSGFDDMDDDIPF